MELHDRVALVTGAARRVGRVIALELARVGAHVVVHYGRADDAARDTAAEIAALGVESMVHGADLADPDQVAGLFAAVESRFGRLDVLVNSAATFTRQPFDDIGPDDWDAVMAVNLRAPFLSVQHAARLMRASRHADDPPGLVVNIADLSAVYSWRGYAHHGVSKAGVLHLTRVAARELAPDVRVNAVVPGPILPPPGMSPDSDAWRRIGRSVPLGHNGEPAHVAQTVTFLAANDFVTGAVLHVDGGEHLLGPVNH